MSRRHIFRAVFLALLLLLLVQLVLIFRPFFAPIAWAVILASSTYPLHRVILHWTGHSAPLAATISTALITMTAVVPAMSIVLLGIQETAELMEWLSDAIKAGQFAQVGKAVSDIPSIGHLLQEMIGRFIVSHSRIQTSVLQVGQAVTAFIAEQGPDLAKNAAVFALDFLLMLFTLFFLYRDGEDLQRRLYRMIPLEEDHKEKIFGRLDRTVTAVVRGTLLTAFAQGLVAGLAYWLLGISYPIFLGALSGLLALLPVGGTALVWGPVTVHLLAQGELIRAFILVVTGAVLIGLMDNLLWPFLVGQRTHLPMLFLFFASLGGMWYFGFIGLFIGPLLLSIMVEALHVYEEIFHLEEGTRIVRSS
jgi:predicted PurR-regulated permease PerM